MRGRAALALFGLALTGCTARPQPDPFARFDTFAPTATVAAQLPLYSNGGEAYQDHAGPAFPVRAAPPLQETGAERIPDFPGDEPPMAQSGDDVLMPNGGERIVQSRNSLP